MDSCGGEEYVMKNHQAVIGRPMWQVSLMASIQRGEKRFKRVWARVFKPAFQEISYFLPQGHLRLAMVSCESIGSFRRALLSHVEADKF
jgi:hypothetical protein